MKFLSNINKIKDFLNFDEFRKIRITLKSMLSNQLKLDYGSGYFYQSLSNLNISGLRDSASRIKNYNLEKLTINKSILDIGSNTGFILFEMKNNFKKATGIEYNTSLVNISNYVKNIYKIHNINFINDNFVNYNFNGEKYDLVLSLANHHTYDEGIKDTNNFFSKINDLLNINGYLILESHHPKIETSEDFNKYLNLLKNSFNFIEISKKKILSKNFYDNGRLLVVLKKLENN